MGGSHDEVELSTNIKVCLPNSFPLCPIKSYARFTVLHSQGLGLPVLKNDLNILKTRQTISKNFYNSEGSCLKLLRKIR